MCKYKRHHKKNISLFNYTLLSYPFSRHYSLFFIFVYTSNDQTELLVFDPELGSDLDNTKQQWLWKDLGGDTDPDTFLVPRLYDAPQMERINAILDKYAAEYSQREQNIKDYLESIGRPLGKR